MLVELQKHENREQKSAPFDVRGFIVAGRPPLGSASTFCPLRALQ